MRLQKGLLYFCTKHFLPALLYFWNYNPSPNGQIVSLIWAQAHLQIQLLWAEWYTVLNILHCRISPTKNTEEKVKLQSYILSFLFFFCWKAIYENAYKCLHKGTEIYLRILVIILKCIFAG